MTLVTDGANQVAALDRIVGAERSRSELIREAIDLYMRAVDERLQDLRYAEAYRLTPENLDDDAALPEPVGRRPVLLVTRSTAIAVRSAVTVAPVTRTIRELASEVPVGPAHGLRTASVADCDSLQTIPKSALRRRLGTLAPEDLPVLDRALRVALDIR